MKFNDAFIEQLKSSVDIVHVVQGYGVRLRKSGSGFLGLCPFHQEKTPSFNVKSSPPFFYCFGCHEKGDVISFVQKLERISFAEAIASLAEKFGLALPSVSSSVDEDAQTKERQVLLKIHDRAVALFRSQLGNGSEGKEALSYLKSRGLGDDTLNQFAIGYAPGFSDFLLRRFGADFSNEMLLKSGLIQSADSGRNYDRFRRRLIFPIRSESGKVIAFGGRILGDGQPKYLNSPETPIYTKKRTLYALDRSRDPIRRSGFAILVEGYMDCIGLFQAGIQNVVASCGTAFSELQARLLARFTERVVVNFDPDNAGSKATLQSLGILLEHGFKIRVLVLPAGDDPDAFIRTHGESRYRKLLDQSPSCFEYLLQKAEQENDLKSVEGKVQAVNQILPYLTLVSNRMERVEQTRRVAEFFGFEESIIREELRKSVYKKPEERRIVNSSVRAKLTTSEKYLLKVILSGTDAARAVIDHLSASHDYRGLQSEGIFNKVIAIFKEEGRIDPVRLIDRLDCDQEKEFVNQALFSEVNVDQTEHCLEGMRRQRAKLEIDQLQKKIRQAELSQDYELLTNLHSRKTELKRALAT